MFVFNFAASVHVPWLPLPKCLHLMNKRISATKSICLSYMYSRQNVNGMRNFYHGRYSSKWLLGLTPPPPQKIALALEVEILTIIFFKESESFSGKCKEKKINLQF